MVVEARSSGERADTNGAALRAEGAFLFRSIFQTEPSASALDLYVRACTQFLSDSSSQDNSASIVRLALARRSDIEAVEYALRFRSRSNLLTRKLTIVAHLFESETESFDRCFNRRRAPIAAFHRSRVPQCDPPLS